MTTSIPTTGEPKARKHALATVPPLHPHADLHGWARTLVFAPHPDDESLGCGGLIALLRERGLSVAIVFVSDGAMSHPNSRRYDRAARVALRRREAIRAAAELGVDEDCLYFLEFPDTRVPRLGDDDFTAAAARCADLLDRLAPTHLLVPWRRDPHCDHRATWELGQTAIRDLANRPRWIEYPIWMWNSEEIADLPRAGEVLAWRIDVSEQLDRKWRAVDCHRSQLTDLIDDDPEGFRLLPTMLDNFRRETELYFEPATKQHITLQDDYFSSVYAASDDPWSFETSAYERAKYDHTLSVLPRPRYASGLEIGCSIGVLTERLAGRCEQLLCLDIAEAPLRRARARLADRPHVRFRRASVPEEFPAETFDLIVVSEVGYYWSYEDLDRAIDLIYGALRPGGTLVLVHYTPYVPDYPLTGDEVHHAFERKLGRGFIHPIRERRERYRVDVYRRNGDAASA